MFEKFLSENIGDFRQRYEGTYGFYTVDSKRKFLAYLSNIEQEERMLHFIDKDQITYNVRADIPREIGFEFLPPTSSYYNTINGVSFLERIAARQFKRGVCSSNMRIYSVSGIGFSPSRVDFKSLIPVYENSISFKERAQEFKNNKTNVIAISPNLAITPAGLCVFKEKIGNYDYVDTITVNKNGKLFITEIRDALRSCDLDIKVVLNEKA